MIFKSKIEILKHHNVEGIENNPHYLKVIVLSGSKDKLKNIIDTIKPELLIDFNIKKKLFSDWRLNLLIEINETYTKEDYSQLIAEFYYVCCENYCELLVFGLDQSEISLI